MEQAFLQAILERPTAEDSWLVLADWFEENGHDDRAELVRANVELRHESRFRARSRTEKRVRELLAAGVPPVVPEIANSIGMRLALIPAGVFFMGSQARNGLEEGDEIPRRLVRITQPYFLGVTQVTQGQYEAVSSRSPSYFGPQGEGAHLVHSRDQRRLPVENVSYLDIQTFCKRLSNRPEERKANRVYRLPSEAEWEYACRGCICHTAFAVGSRLTARDARFDREGDGHPLPVGSFPPNLFGLYEMHGNVWEWCEDWYDHDYYRYGPRDDPRGPEDGHRRVLRGGGWSTPADLCRSALRGHNTLDARHNYNGFRVAVSVRETNA